MIGVEVILVMEGVSMMALGVWEGGGIFGYRDYGSTVL